MTPAKRFLIGYVAIYFVVAVALNMMLGPPGFSEAYRSEFKAEQDHYLSIIKSDEYKLWKERAELNPATPELADKIAFVEFHEERPAFIAETRRRATYQSLFDLFNVLMVIALVYRFGRKPIRNLLDAKIGEIRSRIERSESMRQSATDRRVQAERTLEGLKDQRENLAKETEAIALEEIRRIEESSEQSLLLLEKETQDRKDYETILARRAVKEELLDAGINIVIRQHTAKEQMHHADPLIDDFIANLESLR